MVVRFSTLRAIGYPGKCHSALPIGGKTDKRAKPGSVLAVFPLMMILMMTVLMIQMQNFSRFLVCSVAPLGVIGVVLALLVTQNPMGFVSMLGNVVLIRLLDNPCYLPRLQPRLSLMIVIVLENEFRTSYASSP